MIYFLCVVAGAACLLVVRWLVTDPGEVKPWTQRFNDTERFQDISMDPRPNPPSPVESKAAIRQYLNVKPPPPQAIYFEDYDTKSDPVFMYHKWEVDRYIQWLRADRNRLQDELTRAQEVAKRVNKSLEGVL